jgi:hypothetical protein
MDGAKYHFTEVWTNADRFFLADALGRGMSVAVVAAFLGRTEDQVRDQSKAINFHRPPRA